MRITFKFKGYPQSHSFLILKYFYMTIINPIHLIQHYIIYKKGVYLFHHFRFFDRIGFLPFAKIMLVCEIKVAKTLQKCNALANY